VLGAGGDREDAAVLEDADRSCGPGTGVVEFFNAKIRR